jgi:hypothetical protein
MNWPTRFVRRWMVQNRMISSFPSTNGPFPQFRPQSR